MMGKKALKFVLLSVAFVVIGLIVGWLIFVPFAKEPGYDFVTSWGIKGHGPGQFDDPTGIAVAGNQIFVSDSRQGRIQVFDFDGNFVKIFGSVGKGAGNLGRPMNLSIKHGELFVAEYFNDRIQVFALDGVSRRTFGKVGSGAGEFNAPGGVDVGPDGSIYVADFYNHRVQVLSPDGAFIRQLGKPHIKGRGSGSFTDFSDSTSSISFSYPTDVAVSKDGTLYVADGYNDRVVVFAADGTFSHKWGGPFGMNIHGSFQGWFATVTSIAIGPEGNVFVADFYNHRIQKFTAEGVFLTSFGYGGNGEGQMKNPIAIDVSEDGAVFVADFGNNRISKWRQR